MIGSSVYFPTTTPAYAATLLRCTQRGGNAPHRTHSAVEVEVDASDNSSTDFDDRVGVGKSVGNKVRFKTYVRPM
jgi:hypothetical protein